MGDDIIKLTENLFKSSGKKEYPKVLPEWITDNDDITGIETNYRTGFYVGCLMLLNKMRKEVGEVFRTDVISPTHETVEQWEERTGEIYPDYGPIWEKHENEEITDWELKLYVCSRIGSDNIGRYIHIVANHHGKPVGANNVKN